MAAALLGAAAIGQAQTTRATFTVLDRPPNARVSKPEFRVTQARGATIVTILAGEKPTGGYAVEVITVERAGNTCTVRYKVEAPAPDAMVTQALTYPATAIRISPPCSEIKLDPPLPRGAVK